jgi:hypothetical protein
MNGGQADGRERFLKAIAERIAPERIEEVHLFPAIRQGGREMGVAVIAVRLEEPVAEEGAPVDAPGEVSDDVSVQPDKGDATQSTEMHATHPDEADATAAEPEATAEEPVDSGELTDQPPADAGMEPDVPPPESTPPRRFTIFRASYRLTLKGAERGKWEMGVVEEADAPASTVEEVVRGVHERAAVADDGPERLTGDAFRALIAGAGEPWTASR